jgi:hypothetical protein
MLNGTTTQNTEQRVSGPFVLVQNCVIYCFDCCSESREFDNMDWLSSNN